MDDETLAELATQPRTGHGRWSHTDLILAEAIDRLGHLCYALRAYERPPEPYRRPGIAPKRHRKGDPTTLATIRAIAEEHARLHGYDLQT